MSPNLQNEVIAVGIDVGGKDSTVACVLTKSNGKICVDFKKIVSVSEFREYLENKRIFSIASILVIDAPLTYSVNSPTGARAIDEGNPNSLESPNYKLHQCNGNVIKPNSFRGLGRAIALGQLFRENKISIAETHPGAVLKQLTPLFTFENRRYDFDIDFARYKSDKDVLALLWNVIQNCLDEYNMPVAFQNSEVIDWLMNDDCLDAFVCALVGFLHTSKTIDSGTAILSQMLRTERWDEDKSCIQLIATDAGLYLDLGGEKPTPRKKKKAA